MGLFLCPPKIAAMRAGLLCVVPQPVLDLLTWQMMEKKVCGDSKITVSDLRRFSKCLSCALILPHAESLAGGNLGEDEPEGPWVGMQTPPVPTLVHLVLSCYWQRRVVTLQTGTPLSPAFLTQGSSPAQGC